MQRQTTTPIIIGRMSFDVCGSNVSAKNQGLGLPPPFFSLPRSPPFFCSRYREKKAGTASAFFSRRGKKTTI